MIPNDVEFRGNLRLKRVTVDKDGNETLRGYNFKHTGNVRSRGFIITSFTHPEGEIMMAEKWVRMRYSVWTEEDDLSLKWGKRPPEIRNRLEDIEGS